MVIVKLSNGMEVEFDDKSPKKLFETIISEILIPKFKSTDDWNLAINVVLEEINGLIRKHKFKPKLKLGLLNQIEEQLDKSLAELTGVGKIEILFLNMDDYIEDIEKLILGGLSKETLRDNMASMVGSLTLFEIGELFIHLGKKAFLK